MTHTLEKPSATSAGLMNVSMLLYLFWLLLPAVQTTGGPLRARLRWRCLA